MRLLTRFTNLARGLAGQWIRRRERRNPGAVYESAIAERLDQYGALRSAAAGVLYMRTKLSRELEQKSKELARIARQLEIAVDRDDDVAALALIGHRDAFAAEVERLKAELRELTEEADVAKKNLVAFRSEIEHLREEKVRMLARLANAKTRLRLHETLSGLSADADIRALEAVREHVSRLVTEANLSRSDGDLEERLGKIRAAEADAAARSQLEEMKRARRRSLVPLVLPEREPVSVRPAAS